MGEKKKIIDIIDIPARMLRKDAEDRAAEVAAEYLSEVRDRLATPAQVAKWAAAGGRWWETPPTAEEEEDIQENMELRRQHGLEPDPWISRMITLRIEGDRRMEVWDNAHKVLDVLAPLGPGEDVRDAALAWASSASYKEVEEFEEAVQAELAVVRRRIATAAIQVEQVDLDVVAKENDYPDNFGEWPEEVRVEGVLCRLSAGLSSLYSREDGQTYITWSDPSVSEVDGMGRPAQARQRLRWWSDNGCWSWRAWQLSATLVTEVDRMYGDTKIWLEDIEFTVVGAGGVTAFRGRPLGEPIAGALRLRQQREQARRMAGLDDDLIDEIEWDHREVSAEAFAASTVMFRVRELGSDSQWT